MATINCTSKSIITENTFTLHEMFDIISKQLSQYDLDNLNLVNSSDGASYSAFDLFLALESRGMVDVTKLDMIALILCRILNRYDLLHHVSLCKKPQLAIDPVDKYLEENVQSSVYVPGTGIIQSNHNSSQYPCICSKWPHYKSFCECRTVLNKCENNSAEMSSKHNSSPNSQKRKCNNRDRCKSKIKKIDDEQNNCNINDLKSSTSAEIKKKVSCDIRLRVRAEYCEHNSALQGHVISHKLEAIERQFEQFSQANAILKARDLGSIVCDIKFSELTYLDAFWRDYINGSLLEALKGVFITDTFKQAVGHEAIKLLVNVDENDYDRGRLILLENLKD